MFFEVNKLKSDARMKAHWDRMWMERNSKKNPLVPNLDLGFWREIDQAALDSRRAADGMEILEDLSSLQRTLHVGKTIAGYTESGSISDEVKISIDGQLPYSYDDTAGAAAGDPVPMITAGFGVNWRKQAGFQSANLDAVLDAQQAKMQVYNEQLVDYLLYGAENIVVEGAPALGLTNHSNTQAVTDTNSHLSTGTQQQLDALFTTGVIGQALRDNRVGKLDVAWVSPEVFANLQSLYVVGGNTTDRTIAEALGARWGIGEFRQTYALSGNQMLGYVRERFALQTLVGMPTTIVARPRPVPTSNYNFDVLGALGVQVKKRSGNKQVFYVSN